ncbi:Mediator of RNA polymerase II transcription subunit 6 [Rhodotorula kratochvilovae]
MAAPAAPVNLSHLQWRAPEYLLTTGGTLATAEQAMDYFSYSPFFDKRSNNATLRMQMMFANGGMQGVDEEKELRRLTGLEFAVSPLSRPQDDLFIIHKRQRTSPDDAAVVGAFYILNGNVYQAPSVFEVINERVLTSLHALSTSFAALAALKPAWTPERAGAWEIKPPPAAAASLADAGAAAADGAEGADEAGEPAASAVGGEKRALEAGEEGDGAPEAKRALTPGAAAAAAKGADAEGVERPAEAFNPLLWRAVQAAAARGAADAVQGA